MNKNRGYEPVHEAERKTLEAEPDLGGPDVSVCLPGWLKTFCEKFSAREGWELSHNAVNAIAHTLIAARARAHRLIRERDDALRELKELKEIMAPLVRNQEGLGNSVGIAMSSGTNFQRLLGNRAEAVEEAQQLRALSENQIAVAKATGNVLLAGFAATIAVRSDAILFALEGPSKKGKKH